MPRLYISITPIFAFRIFYFMHIDLSLAFIYISPRTEVTDNCELLGGSSGIEPRSSR